MSQVNKSDKQCKATFGLWLSILPRIFYIMGIKIWGSKKLAKFWFFLKQKYQGQKSETLDLEFTKYIAEMTTKSDEVLDNVNDFWNLY